MSTMCLLLKKCITGELSGWSMIKLELGSNIFVNSWWPSVLTRTLIVAYKVGIYKYPALTGPLF